MKNLKFLFFIWGKEYIKVFNHACLEFLIEELRQKFFNQYNISLEIWTNKNNTNDFNFKNIINKNIKFEIVNFNSLYYFIKSNNYNKYEILNTLQRLSFVKNFKTESLVFLLYPDFIWKIGSIKKIIENMHNKCFAAVYAPQVIEENFLNKKKIKENINKFIFNNLHPIVTNNAINNKINKASTAACLTYKKGNNIHFRNFHLHPVCLNFNLRDINFLNNFYTSLDEDFFGRIKLNKKNIYLPKNSNQVMFASLFSKKNFKSYKAKIKTIKLHKIFVDCYCDKNHFLISRNKFHLKKNSIDKKTDDTKLDNYLKKLYQKNNSKLDTYMKQINFFHNNKTSTSKLDFLHYEILKEYNNNNLNNNIHKIFKDYKFSQDTFEFLYEKIYKKLLI